MIAKKQCRAVSGQNGWAEKQPAEAAQAGVITGGRFEAEQGETYPAIRVGIVAALERSGVEFIAETAAALT